MRAFVTGGTGLLGNNLIRTLLDHGWTVRALARSRTKAQRVLGDRDVDWVEGDLDDVGGWAGAISGSEVLFHTAAMFREYDGDPKAWERLVATNVEGTLAVARAAAASGVRRFVDTSTGGLIGTKPDGSPGDETSDPPPIAHQNLYFRSKLETLPKLEALGRETGLEILHIHPGWMFGPHDGAPTAAGRLVADFLAGQLPVIPAGGSTVADARDVAFGMMRAAERGAPGSRWVLGGRYADLWDVGTTLAEVTGRPKPRFYLPDTPALGFAWASERWGELTGKPSLVTVMAMHTMQARHRIDSARAERELGVVFRPLAETLRDCAAWTAQNAARSAAPAA